MVDASLNKNKAEGVPTFNINIGVGKEFFPDLKKIHFLEEVIDSNLEFVKKTNLPKTLESGLKIASSPEDLLAAMAVRSEVFTPMGYDREFPDQIQGLNFDSLDKNSLIMIYKPENQVLGTNRLIIESPNGLQSERIESFNPIIQSLKTKYEEKGQTVAEGGRTAILDIGRHSGVAYRQLIGGMYSTAKQLNVGNIISSMSAKMFESLRYEKSGMMIVETTKNYGNIDQDSVLVSWPLDSVTPFFKRAFLRQQSRGN